METELLIARIKDTEDICARTNRPKYLGFLFASEAVFAEKAVKNSPCRTALFGGYDGAERLMLACFPDWMEDDIFPISAVTFEFRKSDSLSHRDFLGSLMALGIKREAVGDILIEEGRAVAFVTEEITDYVKTQISKIGRVGVSVKDGYNSPLPNADRLEKFSSNAASDRLDCIISALCGFSRSKSAEVLNAGLVTVNSVCEYKATKTVSNGDIISVRGKGRFIIDSLEDRTRKNRIVIKYSKYI